MSNNIYDILNKINKLEGRVQTLKESKSMDKKKEDKKDESKKKDKADKGAIAEAVAKVEKQLSEKYHNYKKAVEESGLMYHAGVKKHGKKYMDLAKEAEMGEGYFGDNVGKIGIFDIPEFGVFSYKRSKFEKELDNNPELAPYKDEILDELQSAYNRFRNFNKAKQAALELGDYHRRYYPKKAQKSQMAGVIPVDEGSYNEEMLSPKQKKFAALAEPKDKITYADKIAGAKKGTKNEGPEILKIKADQAKAQGKDSFEVGGKTFPVKEGFPSKEEAEKRMKEKEGKTAHGKKTTTKTGVKHERDYDKHDSEKDTGDEKKGRGRPKKDKFAK